MPDNLSVQTISLTREFKLRKGFLHFSKEKKKTIIALEDVNLEIQNGELFGLLGSNGAGKTTLIKILTTLLLPTRGQAFVKGYDVVNSPDKVKKLINMVSGGESSGYGILTLRETLWMFSQFYGIPTKIAYKKIDEHLERLGLTDVANRKVNSLSTGMKQKMNFIRGFITDPKVIFLDEPTLGLDVESSIICRRFIKEWIKEKDDRTVLLTTHYMTEAEQLCDRIAIIHDGKILVCDTFNNLKKLIQKDTIFSLTFAGSDSIIEKLSNIGNIKSILRFNKLQDDLTEVHLSFENDKNAINMVSNLSENGLNLISFQKREPSLEDVFIHFVGKKITDEGNLV